MSKKLPQMLWGFGMMGARAVVIFFVTEQSFWQYYPKDNPNYNSKYVTEGVGNKPPYGVGQEVVENLSLPPHNAGTAVRRMGVDRQNLDGPTRVDPDFGQPGGGIQYIIRER